MANTIQAKVFTQGQLLRASAVFKKRDGTLFDPTQITFRLKSPGASPQIRSYVYGVGTEVVKEGTGRYYTLVDADAGGTWHGRWEGTGAFQTADELAFTVRRGAFA